jgi:hypothetical protein
MSIKEFFIVIAILVTTLTILTWERAATISLSNSAFAQGEEKFVADLSVS